MCEQEKRRHARIHFERKVQLDFFTEIYGKCQVKNISLGGMFICGEFPHKLNDQCNVHLAQKGNRSYFLLTALARVVRQETEGIAIEFISMSFESLLSLEMILLYQSSNVETKLPDDLPFEICDETTCSQDRYNPFLKLSD